MKNLKLKYSITEPQQQMFAEATAKYNIVPKGRRLGFTKGFAIYCIKSMLQGKTPILWGDTTISNILKYYERYFLPLLNQVGKDFYVWNQQKKELRLASIHTTNPRSDQASILDFRSADIPANWEGFGYQLVILNEAGIILQDEYLYNNAVLPMMLDFPDSRLIAGGVPKGMYAKDGSEHPFYKLYLKAKAGERKYKLFEYTSYDNPILSKEEIDSLVEDLGGIESPYVLQEVYGRFVNYNGKPFCYAFNRDKHISEDAVFKPHLDLHVSFDFNIVNTAVIIQSEIDYYTGLTNIYIIDEVHEENYDLEMTILAIKERYPDVYFYKINGDPSGNYGSATSTETAYQQVRAILDLSLEQFSVPTSHPSHLNSYIQTNNILKKANFIIHPRCKGTIRDFEMVRLLQKAGKKIEIDKSDLTLTHFLDAARYYFWMEHHDFFKYR
jgi:hypothetical protein